NGGNALLSWSGPGLPAGGTYVLYVDDDNHLGPNEPTTSRPEEGESMRVVNATGSSATVNGLTPGKTYYWHVEAQNSGGGVVAGSALGTAVGCANGSDFPLQSPPPANGLAECGLPYSYSDLGAPTVSGVGPFQFTVSAPSGETLPAGLSVTSSTG